MKKFLARLLEENNFVVLDTETTGIRNARAVSIAIIDANGEPIINCLVNPGMPIPPDATRIHGITDEDVRLAPRLEELAPRINQILSGKHLVGYNVSYDIGVLRQHVDFTGTLSETCIMEIFAKIYGDWNDYHQSYRWQKLTTAARYYGISDAGAHGALADTKMTLEVMRAIVNRSERE